MEKRFVLKIDLPEEVTVPEMAAYIRESVREFHKQWSSEDPLARINNRSITVRPVPRRKRRLHKLSLVGRPLSWAS